MLSYKDRNFSSIKITDENDYVDSFATNGNWIVYVCTSAEFDDNGEFDTQSKLKINYSLERNDLKFEYADYNFFELKPNKNMPISIGITNNGT